MEDVYNDATKTNATLVCRAKEVSLTSVTSGNNSMCVLGTKIKVDLVGTIEMASARYDLGWYIGTDGGDALTGQCAINSLSDANTYNISGGSLSWTQDAKFRSDVCGDVFSPSASNDKIAIHGASLGKQIELVCEDVDSDGYMDFSICFSWRTATTDSVCDPSGIYPESTTACDCATYAVTSITVETNKTHSTCV